MSDLKPCRSPYCECDEGKCTHPGFYDARGEVLTAPQSPELAAAICRIRELESQLLTKTIALSRYEEREKTMGWNQS